MSNFNKVGTFMKTFGQEVKTKPSFSSDKINKLRIDLIKEELDELQEAMKNNDLLEVADALTDILYVTYGAGHAFGIDLDKCFDEVQNSNMSKLGENGEPIYNESGKVMKGPNYFKPNLSKFEVTSFCFKFTKSKTTALLLILSCLSTFILYFMIPSGKLELL